VCVAVRRTTNVGQITLPSAAEVEEQNLTEDPDGSPRSETIRTERVQMIHQSNPSDGEDQETKETTVSSSNKQSDKMTLSNAITATPRATGSAEDI